MSVVFFTDRDLGHQFPAILKAGGLTVERHSDHFTHNCPDDTWLGQVSAKGWVAVTHDSRIRYKPNELAAVVVHKAALLVVVARAFVATSPKILTFVAEQARPFIAKVYRASPAALRKNPAAAGHVELWYPPQR